MQNYITMLSGCQQKSSPVCTLTQAEGMILGAAEIAGPVIVYGVSASVVYGLIY